MNGQFPIDRTKVTSCRQKVIDRLSTARKIHLTRCHERILHLIRNRFDHRYAVLSSNLWQFIKRIFFCTRKRQNETPYKTLFGSCLYFADLRITASSRLQQQSVHVSVFMMASNALVFRHRWNRSSVSVSCRGNESKQNEFEKFQRTEGVKSKRSVAQRNRNRIKSKNVFNNLNSRRREFIFGFFHCFFFTGFESLFSMFFVLPNFDEFLFYSFVRSILFQMASKLASARARSFSAENECVSVGVGSFFLWVRWSRSVRWRLMSSLSTTLTLLSAK